MRRVLLLTTYIRVLEVVLIVVLSFPLMFTISVVRLYIALTSCTTLLLFALAIYYYTIQETSHICLPIVLTAIFMIDIAALSLLILNNVQIVTMYVSTTVNIVADLVLLLLSYELVRK